MTVAAVTVGQTSCVLRGRIRRGIIPRWISDRDFRPGCWTVNPNSRCSGLRQDVV
jgi:hypothetical protein